MAGAVSVAKILGDSSNHSSALHGHNKVMDLQNSAHSDRTVTVHFTYSKFHRCSRAVPLQLF